MPEENKPKETTDDVAPPSPEEDADDSRYNYVRSKLDAHEKALASHGGILNELKDMLGGFISTSKSGSAPPQPPADPEPASPARKSPPKKKQWF